MGGRAYAAWVTMAPTLLKPHNDTDSTVRQLQQSIDVDALCEENRQLKDLVVQLSKLVIRRVVEQH